MAFLELNGDAAIVQPTGVKEELIRQVHDKISIKGVVRRIWLADKHQVTLTWQAINLEQYNYIAQYIYNEANALTYYNNVTGTQFTGFPTASEDQFIPGANWLKNITVTIIEE